MMADELLNAQDLITAKKHDTFHSEVITGKTGGLSTGANIDYATNAVTGQVQKTLPATVNGIDWSPVGNLTTDNCTFTKATDYAVDDSGTQWAYNGTLPFTSTAPVVPSAPDYYVVHVNAAEAITNANGGSVQDFIDGSETKFSKNYQSVADAIADLELIVGSVFSVDSYYGDGRTSTLFFRVVPSGTGTVDGGKYIETNNGLQLSQNLRMPLHPSCWGAKGISGYDDQPHIEKMITYFKSTLPTPPSGKNYQANGKCLDFSGMTNFISSTVDASGIDNLTLQNPSFIANTGFVGTQLLTINSIDTSWYVENFTLMNPFLDCDWNADLGFYAADFLNIKVIGGKITHYKKKGFQTANINVGSHEINLIGTFIFQREYNETFPAYITEGEAFEIGNNDNNFTNVVVGYQKKWTATLARGANMFSNCHFYSGIESWPESGLRSLDTADDFNLCYFDSVPLTLRSRSKVSNSYFVIAPSGEYAINLPDNDPYRIDISGNRFRKFSGTSVQAIKMKTIADGRINRPDIFDNKYDGCTGIITKGLSPVNVVNSVTTFTVPDSFQPISSFGAIRLSSGADGAFSDRFFSTSYNSTTKQITVNCYAISGGAVVSSNLGGKQALISFNE